ncbi:MAG: ATP-dependent helicase [Mesorhizobium sp.]|nr:MAG: ATP-dependent helicase [Mesorhizobium sp.]
MTVPTYGKLALQGNRWVLSDIPPHVAIRLKSMFARIPKTTTGKFDLPFTDEMCADLQWFESRYRLTMSDKDRAALERGTKLFEADRIASEAILLPDWQPSTTHGFRPGFAPYHHQKQASALLHKKKGLLLGDVMGQGKTWSALDAIIGSPYLPAAVVAKTHLPTQWVEEFIKPFTYLSAHIIKSTTPYRLPPANVYLFKYSNIAGWVDYFGTGFFKAAIFDEAHELRNGIHTSKGKAAAVLADNAAIRLSMTGTPIFNYGSEIFNIMRFVNPDILGTWEEFVIEWCRMGTGGKWLVKDPEALGTYLRSAQVFLRRLRQGRPINKIVVDVDYDEDIAAKSEDLARTLAIKATTGSFVERGQAVRELDAMARQVTGLAKAKSVAAYVRMLMKAGRPVLLFGWHRSVYEVWLKELAEFKPVMFTGSESTKQKERSKQAFINGDTDLMIMSLRSGDGTDGLQKRCSTVVIGEMDWSPAVLSQGIGRVDRPGQPQDVIDVIYLIANSGSDPVLVQVNAIKSDQARGVIDPGLGVQPALVDESRLKALAEHYLQKLGTGA